MLKLFTWHIKEETQHLLCFPWIVMWILLNNMVIITFRKRVFSLCCLKLEVQMVCVKLVFTWKFSIKAFNRLHSQALSGKSIKPVLLLGKKVPQPLSFDFNRIYIFQNWLPVCFKYFSWNKKIPETVTFSHFCDVCWVVFFLWCHSQCGNMDAELHLQALGAEYEVLQFIVVGPMPRKVYCSSLDYIIHEA